MSTTPRFEIFSGSLHVGWSELELGDPPMGVAFGRFLPAPGYVEIQPIVVASTGGPLPEDLQLTIRERGGPSIQAQGGVHIADCSAELADKGLEVSVLGVSYPSYGELFPHHVAAYERQFERDG